MLSARNQFPGTVKSVTMPVAPNSGLFEKPRAVSLDDRSLGPHHGAAHPPDDPGQKHDPAIVTTYAPPSSCPCLDRQYCRLRDR